MLFRLCLQDTLEQQKQLTSKQRTILEPTATDMQSTDSEATAQLAAISQSKASSNGGCARARPWLNHNSNLWVFALPNGEGYENAQASPFASQMQDVDITSPTTPGQAHSRTHTDHATANLGQRFEVVTANTAHATTPKALQVCAMYAFVAQAK